MRCGPLHVALCRSFWAMLMNSWRRSSKFWFAFAPLYCMSYFSYLFKESKFGSIDFFSIIFNCIDFCSVFKIIFFILLAFGLFCSFSSGYLRCKLKLLILDSSSFSVLACVCVCVCVCVSCSVMSDSLQPHGPQPTRLPCLWDSPGKNTGVTCYSILHQTRHIML